MSYLDSRRVKDCKFTRLGVDLARCPRLFVRLVGVTLGLKHLRLRQRSPWLAVSSPAVIWKLLEFDRDHCSSAEAVSGRRVLGSDYPGARPGQGAQSWPVQILTGDD